MATYYLVASGNWSNSAIWSLTPGGAGGAGAPGVGDDVSTYRPSPSSFTLNIDVNINVNSITTSFNFTGTVNFGSGSHIVGRIQPDGGTINFQSSTITVGSMSVFQVGGSGAINAGTAHFILTGGQVGGHSTRKLNINSASVEGRVLSLTDVNINSIYAIRDSFSGARISIQNSNTFSVRKIVAKNKYTNPNIDAFPATGSPANISIVGPSIVALDDVIIKNINISGSSVYYAGSSSTDDGGNTGWQWTTTPLATTLIDNFTSSTINTTKWTATNANVAQTSGWVGVSSFGSTRSGSLVSKEQYLAEGSSIKFKQSITSGGKITAFFANASQQYGISATTNIPDIYVTLTDTTGQFFIKARTTYTSTTFTNNYLYYRIRESSGTIYLDGSSDGIVYVNVKSAVASNYGLDTTQLTSRPMFTFESTGTSSSTVGAFNIDLEPTAEFTATPVSGNTPITVNFTDQSNFGPTNWSWSFGDSTTSTAQNPTKTYSAAGTYSVSLTSSKTGTSRSVTKTGFITVNPNVYTRSISGTMRFSGGASRTLYASRSISGGIVFGGSVRSVIIRDAEGLQDKRYLYKVYDPDGNYIEVWKDVVSDLEFTHELNSIGSTTMIELARNSDTVGVIISPLQTEDGRNLLTEDNLDILVATESRNQVGSGSSVDYNNRVDITVFYGSVEPLYTEDMEELLTEDDEQVLAELGAPNGRRIFTGFISEINSRYGSTETTLVQLTSYGWDLDQFPITTSDGKTTVPFLSQDPSQIAKDAVDKFVTDSTSFGTYTERTDTSIATTGTVVSYTFRANTYKEVLDKTLELMPPNWYYRIGLGDNIVYFNERRTTPHHFFYLGKHIKTLDLKGSILNSVNRVLFTGGGDPALYIDRSEVPADRTRRSLSVMSDSRVTVQDSAEIIAEGAIGDKNKMLPRTTIEILTKQYDIETINVGDTVGFRNFGDPYVDALIMQVIGLSYSPDSVQLQLDTKPPTISKRLEDVRRNLTVTENQNIPDAPS